MKIILAFTFCVFVSLSALAAPLTGDQRDEVKDIVKTYIADNPDQVALAVKSAQSNAGYFADAKRVVVGNPNGDVTVVEFFDYNCGYCHSALGSVRGLIKADKDVRVVLVDMPILSENSRLAALWALAAHNQGKYFDYHVALMESQQAKTPEKLEEIAAKLGLDVARMRVDAASAEVGAALEEGISVANALEIRGTPAFVVDGVLIPGMIELDALVNFVKEARVKKNK